MNILDEANKIVNERSEEKERAYGSFSEGMKRAASIASGMTGKDITADDMFACMVALKFSRQSFNHKTDNLLDAVAYIGAWQNFIEERKDANDKLDKLKQELNEVKEFFKNDGPTQDIPSDLWKEYVAEDVKHLSPVQEIKDLDEQKEFKQKFEEEVFGEKTLPSWASMRPADAFKELDEKLQVMTDSIIAVHNNMMDIKKEVNMNTEYAKYLAENIDKSITYQEYLAEQLDATIGKIETNGINEHIKTSFLNGDKYFPHSAKDIDSGAINWEGKPVNLKDHLDVLTKYIEYVAEHVKQLKENKPVDAGDAGPN